jgi:hypothetical protein
VEPRRPVIWAEYLRIILLRVTSELEQFRRHNSLKIKKQKKNCSQRSVFWIQSCSIQFFSRMNVSLFTCMHVHIRAIHIWQDTGVRWNASVTDTFLQYCPSGAVPEYRVHNYPELWTLTEYKILPTSTSSYSEWSGSTSKKGSNRVSFLAFCSYEDVNKTNFWNAVVSVKVGNGKKRK